MLPVSNCIFVSGQRSSGKSMLLNKLLSYQIESTVFVNVNECLSEHMLFQRIINKWSNSIPTIKSDFKAYSACKDAAVFIENVKKVCKDGPRRYLVL
jgi:predicted AAA+ superfamily ATPase